MFSKEELKMLSGMIDVERQPGTMALKAKIDKQLGIVAAKEKPKQIKQPPLSRMQRVSWEWSVFCGEARDIDYLDDPANWKSWCLEHGIYSKEEAVVDVRLMKRIAIYKCPKNTQPSERWLDRYNETEYFVGTDEFSEVPQVFQKQAEIMLSSQMQSKERMNVLEGDQ
jgi:hypothetical protein